MPAPNAPEHSKSIKQALLMEAQSHPLDDADRRIPRHVAQNFHANDRKAGYWFDSEGNPKEKSER